MKNLTANQANVVKHTGGELAVIAGPGSGKTTVLVERITYQVQQGHVTPGQIVVLTYTVAAGLQLTKRLAERGVTGLKYCGTLHGFCFGLIQTFGDKLGFPRTLTILAEGELDELIDSAIKECRVNVSKGEVRAAVAENPVLFREGPKGPAYTVAMRVIVQMFRAGAIDYSLMLSCGRYLLRFLPEGSNLWLFVDEAQDSADMDFAIYRELRVARRFIVGDPDQSIYSFRGGKPENFLAYCASPMTKRVALTENFRSAPIICETANNLIAHNSGRIEKRIEPARTIEGRVRFMDFADDLEERLAIVEFCRTSIAPEIAILCRTNHEVEEITGLLQQAGIPATRLRQQSRSFDDEASRALSLMVNPSDERVYAYVSKKEGKLTADRLRVAAGLAGATLWVKRYGNELPSRKSLLEVLGRMGVDTGPGTPAVDIDNLNQSLPPDATLADLQLAWRSTSGSEKSGQEKVTVGTIHAAKGLEWDSVWLPGWAQIRFPGNTREKTVDWSMDMMMMADNSLEEERRLAFVGLTRAKTTLMVSFARLTTPNKYHSQPVESEPSQFIAEAAINNPS